MRDSSNAGSSEDIDTFVPDRQACKEFSITPMTGWRWDRDEKMIALGWPTPVTINGRKFRSRRQLEALKSALLQRAIHQRRTSADARAVACE